MITIRVTLLVNALAGARSLSVLLAVARVLSRVLPCRSCKIGHITVVNQTLGPMCLCADHLGGRARARREDWMFQWISVCVCLCVCAEIETYKRDREHKRDRDRETIMSSLSQINKGKYLCLR